MHIRFDESHARFKGTLGELPPKGTPHDPEEQSYLIAGHGSCRSCSCAGYVPDKPNYCRCGHSYSQHR